MPITLERICSILAGSLHDADCRIEAGYLFIETESQTIRISLDIRRKGEL